MSRSGLIYSDRREPVKGEGFNPDVPVAGEEWRPVATTPNYAVSSLGRVMRITGGRGVRAGRVLRAVLNSNGYPKVELCTDGVYRTACVHILVCEAFHGPKPSPRHQVAHRDGNRENPKVENLRWATQAENEADKVELGRNPVGERHGNARLTEEQVRAIRAAEGTHEEIGARFGIPRRYVGYLKSGQRWRHLAEGASA